MKRPKTIEERTALAYTWWDLSNALWLAFAWTVLVGLLLVCVAFGVGLTLGERTGRYNQRCLAAGGEVLATGACGHITYVKVGTP